MRSSELDCLSAVAACQCGKPVYATADACGCVFLKKDSSLVPHPDSLHKPNDSTLDDSGGLHLPWPWSCHLCALEKHQSQDFLSSLTSQCFTGTFVFGPSAELPEKQKTRPCPRVPND